MAAKSFILILFVVFCSGVQSASLLERSYDFVMGLGKNLAPSFLSILDCLGEDDAWNCAKMKAGKMLDSWDEEVDKQRKSWQAAADAEANSSGRSMEELPSKLGKEVEDSLTSLADIVQHGVARAMSRKHHEGGGIDSITISTGGQDKKKKMKKKKQKPPKIHLVHPMMMPMKEMEPPTGRAFGRTQSWVIGENSTRKARGLMEEFLSMGDKALDAVAEHAVKSDEVEDGVADKSGVEEQRGKKKKKKKAILKLLILGAVLKAKIGTLLQILSFKLQVKFFILALIGLGINLARFWIDVKKQHQPPQKVIYYEHAQHQHHYDHEEESPGWGPWSRSMDPAEDSDLEDITSNSPYRAHEKPATYIRPLLTRV
ncbi:uncharacterized protein LOC125238807 [Leguminivora glycinivorella]|uniref:uncharacterized protein LOC125238807 n=1 Tax=Leguminivora glycinivorella TaxID=1035111 RepID=UPI00200F7E4F|nr:uncharacterized protein LOC125238807 [Leguminivora glycinivorella]